MKGLISERSDQDTLKGVQKYIHVPRHYSAGVHQPEVILQ